MRSSTKRVSPSPNVLRALTRLVTSATCGVPPRDRDARSRNVPEKLEIKDLAAAAMRRRCTRRCRTARESPVVSERWVALEEQVLGAVVDANLRQLGHQREGDYRDQQEGQPPMIVCQPTRDPQTSASIRFRKYSVMGSPARSRDTPNAPGLPIRGPLNPTKPQRYSILLSRGQRFHTPVESVADQIPEESEITRETLRYSHDVSDSVPAENGLKSATGGK